MDGADMLHHRSHLLRGCFLISDLTVTAFAWLGAYYLRFESGLMAVTLSHPDFFHCLRALPLVLLLALIAYQMGGLYEVHRLRRFREEIVGVAKGTALLTVFVLATLFVLHDPYE